jgi:outer membrane protein assembly factor BamB
MLLLWLALASAPAADDWPQWRGPQRNGVSAEGGWLDRWPEGGPGVLWKAEVGTGFSSFAVAGGRVYTMGHADERDSIVCLDAETGRVAWTHAYAAEIGDKFFEGGPTSTPAVDGGRVYAVARAGEVFCLDAATGKVVWSTNFAEAAGVPAPGWGFGGSPVVHGSLLLLNAGEAGVALEKDTGRLLWKSAAKEAGYSTPLVALGKQLLLGSGRSYLAVDPASGKELWRIRWVTEYGCNAADPVVDGARAFVSSGYGRGGALLELGDGEPKTLWQNKALRTQMNPAVLVGGHLYGIDGDAEKPCALKCLEFATGAEKWSRPLSGPGALVAADGKLVVLDARGELLVGPASPAGFEPTARAQVLSGKCWTAPVLANGRIFCRNAEGRVVCLDVRKPQ